MRTYHIHISGMVQGVGFRPFVCRLAEEMGIPGTVSNGIDGVHIQFNGDEHMAQDFCNRLIAEQPANALIRQFNLHPAPDHVYNGFQITASESSGNPDLMLTPDIAICPQCREEISDPFNRRYQYPFTTCLNCGPRYSIITKLPYDRENTTMAELEPCEHCQAEYNDIHDTRHFSQTNSCPECAIPMYLFDKDGVEISHDTESILQIIQESLLHGHILAIKGIGGYLLLCDATKNYSIRTLRERKQRPSKPFAVLYPSLEMMEDDLMLGEKEKKALLSKTAPIVLCPLKSEPVSGICTSLLAPGLDKLGVMLPYTPLLQLIMQHWNKPLVATSGNLSGAPIIYTDEEALLWLTEYADYIVSFDREIMAPQDDSVWQFSARSNNPIILRRSRGMAPNYYPFIFSLEEPVLAMGAELKSAFALNAGSNLFVSQFLGDQANYDAHLSFQYTLEHLAGLLHFHPEKILIDSHPGYSVSAKGKEIAAQLNIPVQAIQHHKAHFAAVLGENEILNCSEKVLGVVWDGTGYGDDEQIWGGEFFLLEDQDIKRVAHLAYFPQLLGDKMSKEPRISAVSLLRNDIDQLMEIRRLFSVQEREYYLKLIKQEQALQTSSMGRLLDGIAAILKIQPVNNYEGEAAMKLEVAARSCTSGHFEYYPMPVYAENIDWSVMTTGILRDLNNGKDTAYIARKVFVSLVQLIRTIAERSGAEKLAFSGGVFQNALLNDLVQEMLGREFVLYFHRQLSPNDECIGFGQLAYLALTEQNKLTQEKKVLHHL